MFVQSLITPLLALLPVVVSAPLPHYPWQNPENATQWSYIRSGRSGLCISLAPPPENSTDFPLKIGYPVITTNCTEASLWRIERGSGSIGVANTSLVLDAGENPGDFGEVYIWQSFPGLYQQTWYYTDDNRIAIENGDQCLDESDTGLQTYRCTTDNDNQVWYLDAASTVSPSSKASASAALPVSSTHVEATSRVTSAGPIGSTIQETGTATRVTVGSSAAAPAETVAGSATSAAQAATSAAARATSAAASAASRI